MEMKSYFCVKLVIEKKSTATVSMYKKVSPCQGLGHGRIKVLVGPRQLLIFTEQNFFLVNCLDFVFRMSLSPDFDFIFNSTRPPFTQFSPS